MKKILTFFGLLFLVISCKDAIISKPENLIDEDKMTNIIYDLALIEGVKSYNGSNFQNIKTKSFIYKKYKIDSLQFANSIQYYASEINTFKKMYDAVGKRIESNKVHIDSLINKETKNKNLPKKVNQDLPMVK